jgi:hypothetical protein
VATLTVDLGKTTNFTAFTFFDYIQNYVSFTYHASAVAEIFQIDGAPTAIVGQGGPLGNCFTPVVTNGTGRTIGFRARTAQDSIEIQATIVVFFE